MKKRVLIALIALIALSCKFKEPELAQDTNPRKQLDGVRVFIENRNHIGLVEVKEHNIKALSKAMDSLYNADPESNDSLYVSIVLFKNGQTIIDERLYVHD
jgi:hypothetical protein